MLGIDPGRKFIGIAISDPDWRVASPLTVIARDKFAAVAENIGKIIRERNIGAIITGLPKNLDGTEGPAAQSARSFIANLLRQGRLPDPDIPVVFWDERMSTAAVTRFMLEDDMSRHRRARVVDKAAAAYILQGALDAFFVSAGPG